MDAAKLVADAAKGAAVGSIAPGIGSALGAAGGIALDLAPELGQWLFGANSDKTVRAVQDAVATVTGATDGDAQIAALSNPEIAGQLRLQLASIAAEQSATSAKAAQDALVSQLADVANARSATLDLAQSGSAMAWGAAIVSVIVLLTFGSVMALALFHSIPQSAGPVLDVLLGTLGAMATSVVSYWVGSSAGSARKDARLAKLLDASTSASSN